MLNIILLVLASVFIASINTAIITSKSDDVAESIIISIVIGLVVSVGSISITITKPSLIGI